MVIVFKPIKILMFLSLSISHFGDDCAFSVLSLSTGIWFGFAFMQITLVSIVPVQHDSN